MNDKETIERIFLAGSLDEIRNVLTKENVNDNYSIGNGPMYDIYGKVNRKYGHTNPLLYYAIKDSRMDLVDLLF